MTQAGWPEIVCAVTLLSVMHAAQSPRSTNTGTSAATVESVDPIFRQVLPVLQQKSRVPVHLPSRLPDLGQGTDPVYAVLENAAPNRYSIIIAFTPDCNGASVCRLGTLSAEPAGKQHEAGQPVTLATGRHGFFTEAECGANCSDSVVRWREGNIIYTVGIKAGTRSEVVELANAALAVK